MHIETNNISYNYSHIGAIKSNGHHIQNLHTVKIGAIKHTNHTSQTGHSNQIVIITNKIHNQQNQPIGIPTSYNNHSNTTTTTNTTNTTNTNTHTNVTNITTAKTHTSNKSSNWSGDISIHGGCDSHNGCHVDAGITIHF